MSIRWVGEGAKRRAGVTSLRHRSFQPGFRFAQPALQLIVAAGAVVLSSGLSASAQDSRPPPRFGYTSGWHYDGRNDRRDFPANGYFPGNFAANPFASPSAGWLGSRPEHSVLPYPSQVYFGPRRPRE
jgi:hypothetical protein